MRAVKNPAAADFSKVCRFSFLAPGLLLDFLLALKDEDS